MTTFDVFCSLAVLDMREAELAAAENATPKPNHDANQLLLAPGDAKKGAKLFQVSSWS